MYDRMNYVKQFIEKCLLTLSSCNVRLSDKSHNVRENFYDRKSTFNKRAYRRENVLHKSVCINRTGAVIKVSLVVAYAIVAYIRYK